MIAMIVALFLIISGLASAEHVHGLQQRRPSRVAITKHVLPLVAAPYSRPYAPPSSPRYLSKHLPRSPVNLPSNPMLNFANREPISKAQSDIDTLGGRVYMTNISIGDQQYSLIIDTGSSDTWLAEKSFQCISKFTSSTAEQGRCGFGTLYDKNKSVTFVGIPSHRFSTSYTDGEFLSGELGTEELGIGGPEEDLLKVTQTIGIVERGYWNGDGISSGLMGLAYSGLVSNGKELGYSSFIFSLIENLDITPIFSLALSRPTKERPVAGGLLAIGGLPDIEHDGEFITVPIQPLYAKNYALYAIQIDGFDIEPPSLNISSTSTLNSKPPTSTSSPLFSPYSSSTTPSPSFAPRRQTSPLSAKSRSPRPPPKTKSRIKSKPDNQSSTPSPHPHNYPRQAIRPPNSDPNSTILFLPNLTMVIDSGTTLLYVPDDIAERIASLFVPRAIYAVNTNTYMVPCSAAAPRIGVVIAGRSFYIHPDDLMNRGPGAVGDGGVAAPDGVVVDADGAVGALCTIAVQRQGLGDAVLGDSWLKNVLAVFDVGANEMRFSGRENY